MRGSERHRAMVAWNIAGGEGLEGPLTAAFVLGDVVLTDFGKGGRLSGTLLRVDGVRRAGPGMGRPLCRVLPRP